MTQIPQAVMLSLLENILIVLQRIEKKINQCGLCKGYGSRRYQNEDILCSQCDGLGVMRYE